MHVMGASVIVWTVVAKDNAPALKHSDVVVVDCLDESIGTASLQNMQQLPHVDVKEATRTLDGKGKTAPESDAVGFCWTLFQ